MLLKPKKLSFVLLTVFLILALFSTGLSQGVCPISTLKVNRIRGRVISNDKKHEPIAQTKVELIRLGETEALISSTLTDDSGFFEINGIEKGRYALEAWLTARGEPIFKYRIAIRLKRSNDRKSKSLIDVKLGFNCFTSDANVAE